jgi:hypothetical protein
MEEKDVNFFHQGNSKMPWLKISTPHQKYKIGGWGDKEIRNNQIPSTNNQISSNDQYPNSNFPLTLSLSPLGRGWGEGFWSFGDWLLFGIWDLGFGYWDLICSGQIRF